ncbi:hypothetical protein BSKO_04069 [Bryopsis sp. KO-2023]|nr:hypothetical protein BSKO_04069 [Bryopsis sp. KO-2023]
MWKPDLHDEGEHGCGKVGTLWGTSLSGDGEFYLERCRRPWVEKYHWKTGKNPAAVYEIEELRNLHLCGGALDVPKKKASWEAWSLNKIEVGICPAPLLMAEELNSIPRLEILKPLIQESAQGIKDQAKSRRGHLIGNQIQAWQETSERILAVHTVGGVGHKIALSKVEASCDDDGLPDWSDTHIEAVDTVECGASEILQVAVSTPEMGEELLSDARFIAARSRQSVSILSVAFTDGDWKLSMHGRTTPAEASVTDVCFNPYSYPESLLGLDDGSIRVLDLDRLGGLEEGLPIYNLASETIYNFGRSFRGKCKTVCTYGLTPRQIYCGAGSQIKYIDLRADKQLHDIAGFGLDEPVIGLCNGLSNPASICECSHLMSAITTKRALVYDLRCMSSPLLSWKLPSAIGVPSHVDFLLSPIVDGGESDDGDCEGGPERGGENMTAGFDSGEGYGQWGSQGSGLVLSQNESIGDAGDWPAGSNYGDFHDEMGIPKMETQFSQFDGMHSQPEPKNGGGGEGGMENLLQGTVVVGSMVSGEFVQCPFMVGDGKIVLIPEAGSELTGKKRKALVSESGNLVKIRRIEEADNGIPVRHEQTLRTLDGPSFLCRSLKSMNDFDSISCLDMGRLIARLDHEYQAKEGVTHRVLDSEAAEWKGFIKHSADVLGMCFIPFDGKSVEGRVDGILIRQNLVGDLVVDTCERRSDELGENSFLVRVDGADESGGGEGGYCFARKRITQAREDELRSHESHLTKIEIAETELGRVREVNVANGDLRSSGWWEGTFRNRFIPWLTRKETSLEKLLMSVPLYLGRRRGMECNGNSQLVLNYFNVYMELRQKMVKNFQEKGEVWEWGLEKDLLKEVGGAAGGLSVWELQLRRALAVYGAESKGSSRTKKRRCSTNSTETRDGESNWDSGEGEEEGGLASMEETPLTRCRKLPPFLVDVMGQRNLGGVHLCHEGLIREELKSEAGKSKKLRKNVTSRWTRFMPPPDILLDRKKSKELLKWDNESEGWASRFNEVWFEGSGGEPIIEFEESKFVQPWGDAEAGDAEQSNLEEMREVWKQKWAGLALS